jgi:hypothetical protein
MDVGRSGLTGSWIKGNEQAREDHLGTKVGVQRGMSCDGG